MRKEAMMKRERMIEILAEETSTDYTFLTTGQDDECITPNQALTAMKRAVEEETNNLTQDSGKVINLPKRIYLQVGYENIAESDLNESGQLDFQELDHEFTTWCQDRIEDTDPCYIHSSELESLRAEVERLKGCEAIVRELVSDDEFIGTVLLKRKARQWVKDNN